MSNTEEFLHVYSFDDAEQIFFAMRDLLAFKPKQEAVHKFVVALLSAHPRLLELHGEEIYSAVFMEEVGSEERLKVS